MTIVREQAYRVRPQVVGLAAHRARLAFRQQRPNQPEGLRAAWVVRPVAYPEVREVREVREASRPVVVLVVLAVQLK